MQRCDADRPSQALEALAHAPEQAGSHGRQTLHDTSAISRQIDVQRSEMFIDGIGGRGGGRASAGCVSRRRGRDAAVTHLAVLGGLVQGIGHEDLEQRLTGLRPASA